MGKKRERVKKIFADKKSVERGHYSKKTARMILSIVSVLTCVLSVIGFFVIQKLNADFNSEENVLRDLMAENPIISALIMILICMVQVVIAFIPGEVVEIAAGYIFGPIWGTLICLVGITIGSVIAILIARRFGRKLVEAFYPREKLESLPILNDPRKRNAIVFMLFLIPGTPKDLITYIIGLTEMSIPLYILLTFFSRLPSVITSTLSGDAMGEDKWLSALCFLVITGVLSGCGYLLYQYIQKRTSDKESTKK